MIRRLVGFLLSFVEVPGVILLLGALLLSVGFVTDFAINIAVSLLVGAVLMGYGIKFGRRQVMRAVALERCVAETVMLPGMIAELPDEAPDAVREMLQQRLRVAKEIIARETS